MKKGIKVLIIADAWAVFALGMIGPIYAIFVEKIGGDILDASWAYSAFAISSGAVLYLFGKIEDKSRHRELFVVGGYSLIAIGCFMYLFVYNQLTLVLTQVVLGLGNAVLSPAFDSVYSDYLDEKKKASEWAGWEGSGLVVAAIAAVLGGYIAQKLGFKILFITMTTAALIGALVSLNILRKKRYLSSKR